MYYQQENHTELKSLYLSLTDNQLIKRWPCFIDDEITFKNKDVAFINKHHKLPIVITTKHYISQSFRSGIVVDFRILEKVHSCYRDVYKIEINDLSQKWKEFFSYHRWNEHYMGSEVHQFFRNKNIVVKMKQITFELSTAVNNYKKQEVLKLLEEGHNIDGQNSDGMTLLMQAVAYGNIYQIEFLLDCDADVNFKTWKGTALHFVGQFCLYKDVSSVMKLLIKKRIDSKLTDKIRGLTPLTANIHSEYFSVIVKYFDVNAKNDDGTNVLRNIIRERRKALDFEFIKMLIDNGLIMNSEDFRAIATSQLNKNCSLLALQCETYYQNCKRMSLRKLYLIISKNDEIINRIFKNRDLVKIIVSYF